MGSGLLPMLPSAVIGPPGRVEDSAGDHLPEGGWAHRSGSQSAPSLE